MVDPRGGGTQLRAARRRRRARPLRLLRGARLHAGPRAGGQERRDRARLHGAPSGHDDRRHRQCAARRRDADTLPCRADRPGDGTAAAGAHAARRRGGPPLGRGGEVGRARSWTIEPPGGRRLATAHTHDARHAPALERALRGDADGRRLGLQPLAGSGGDPLARGRHLRRLGLLRLPARRQQRRGVVGRLPAERRGARRLSRSPSTRIAPSSCAATEPSRRPWRCSSRRRTMPRSAVSRSPIPATGRARSRSPPMPSWCWRPRPPTSRTRPFPSCSWRPSISPTSAPSWRRGDGARRTSPRSGPHTSPSSTAKPWASRRSRPTGRASSAAAAALARRSR